nr:MAG TPA: hypothetical protein [Caudoviricetes sp.]
MVRTLLKSFGESTASVQVSLLVRGKGKVSVSTQPVERKTWH